MFTECVFAGLLSDLMGKCEPGVRIPLSPPTPATLWFTSDCWAVRSELLTAERPVREAARDAIESERHYCLPRGGAEGGTPGESESWLAEPCGESTLPRVWEAHDCTVR